MSTDNESQTTEAANVIHYDPRRALMLTRSPGNAQTAVHYWRNTAGSVAQSWQRFDWLHLVHHELQRALLGIDPPSAWCGDRNARIRRMLDHARSLPKPRLP